MSCVLLLFFYLSNLVFDSISLTCRLRDLNESCPPLDEFGNIIPEDCECTDAMLKIVNGDIDCNTAVCPEGCGVCEDCFEMLSCGAGF